MTTTRLSIFPLAGALLFPRMHLPLHIFEPRYRAMISDAMARDRRIGMVQPRPNLPAGAGGRADKPALFDIGCVGKIAEFEASEDGRYNLILEGLSLFRIVRELDVQFTFTNEHKTSAEWPFNKPFHLLLNIAIGGFWGGQKGVDDTIFPNRMLVDYVRVYQ